MGDGTGEHFLDNDLAADIAVREAFDIEEAVAYAANLDTIDQEQCVLEVARRERWHAGRRGFGRAAQGSPPC
jgi:hypothetical protein